uniref:Uncharacterized protein n=1 Tax=Lygus hesperus TaxID=30085 RepID=A0A146M1G4_LYGHE
MIVFVVLLISTASARTYFYSDPLFGFSPYGYAISGGSSSAQAASHYGGYGGGSSSQAAASSQSVSGHGISGSGASASSQSQSIGYPIGYGYYPHIIRRR